MFKDFNFDSIWMGEIETVQGSEDALITVNVCVPITALDPPGGGPVKPKDGH